MNARLATDVGCFKRAENKTDHVFADADDYEEVDCLVRVLAVRHQREAGYRGR